MPPPESAFDREIVLPDLAATERLAARLAAAVRPPAVIALHGTLGIGKTALARAFVQAALAAAGAPPEEVPSPTFTLVQEYQAGPTRIVHMDLYRLADPEEAWEIGLEDALVDAILLLEWPERLGRMLPAERIDAHLAPGDGEEARRLRLVAHGRHAAALTAAGIGGAGNT